MDMKELAESVKRIRSAPNDRPDMMETINALVQLVGEMHGALDEIDAAIELIVGNRGTPFMHSAARFAREALTKAAPIAELAKGE